MMIERNNNVTLLADPQILKEKENEDQKHFNQVTEEIQSTTDGLNALLQSNTELDSDFESLTKLIDESIQETEKTNCNIHRLHKYVCDLRANIKVTCRIVNDDATSFLSFPELMYIQSKKVPIHSVNFINSSIEFHFDDVYLPNRNQHETIISGIKSDMLFSLNNKQNFTLFAIDDNNDIFQFVNKAYKVINSCIHDNISLSVFYEESEDQIIQVSQVVIKNENDLIQKDIKKSNVIYQFKIEGNNNERYLTFVSIHSNFKHLVLIGKILFMLSNKKCNKNQVPFKESKFTMALKNVMKPTDKIYFMNTIYNENSIDYLNQLLNANLIY